MIRQYDSSLIPDRRTQDLHDIRQCHLCQRDMTDEEIAIDSVWGDCLCEFCRRMVRERED